MAEQQPRQRNPGPPGQTLGPQRQRQGQQAQQGQPAQQQHQPRQRQDLPQRRQWRQEGNQQQQDPLQQHDQPQQQQGPRRRQCQQPQQQQPRQQHSQPQQQGQPRQQQGQPQQQDPRRQQEGQKAPQRPQKRQQEQQPNNQILSIPAEIRSTMEHYFSDIDLSIPGNFTPQVLQDFDGVIPTQIFLDRYPKLNKLAQQYEFIDAGYVEECLQDSQIVMVTEAGLAPKNFRPVDISPFTCVCVGLSFLESLQNLQAFFNKQFGASLRSQSKVRLGDGSFTWFAMLIFQSPQDMERALKKLQMVTRPDYDLARKVHYYKMSQQRNYLRIQKSLQIIDYQTFIARKDVYLAEQQEFMASMSQKKNYKKFTQQILSRGELKLKPVQLDPSISDNTTEYFNGLQQYLEQVNDVYKNPLLTKKLQTFIDYIDSLDNEEAIRETGTEMDARVQLFVESMNRLQQDARDLEVRLFCFGTLSLPLPVYSLRNKFNDQSTYAYVESATGSGKTLLVPGFVAQIRDGCRNVILSQPNTLLCESIAKTLKQIMGDVVSRVCRPAPENGVQVCVCTPMQILKAITANPKLIEQSRFIIDEFHARTILMDVLFAKLMENRQNMRFPLQLIVMSATPDVELIRMMPNPARFETKDLRPFKVKHFVETASNAREATEDKPSEIAVKIIKQMLDERDNLQPGSILVFTSGNAECAHICQKIIELFKKENKSNKFGVVDFRTTFGTCPDVGAATRQIQQHISNKNIDTLVMPIVLAGKASQIERDVAQAQLDGLRESCIKVIVATNIAETSITIPDLVAVVDSGMFKEASYDQKRGINVLQEKRISPAQRVQRLGRVGRVCNGISYAIDVAQKDGKDERQTRHLPEIERIDIKTAVLELKSINVDLQQIQNYLPNRPSSEALQQAYHTLRVIEALDINNQITPSGERLLTYKNISPVQSYVIEKLAKRNPEWLCPLVTMAIAVQFELITQATELPYACVESDLVTLFFCVLNYVMLPPKQRRAYCAENALIQRDLEQAKDAINATISTIKKQVDLDVFYVPIDDDEDSTQSNEALDELREHFKQFARYGTEQILGIADAYVTELDATEERINPDNLRNFTAVFDTLSNVSVSPRFQFKQTGLENVLYCFERPGLRTYETFNLARFFDVTENTSFNITTGRIMHRRRLGENYRAVSVVKAPVNSMALPYAPLLLNLVADRLGSIRQVQPRIGVTNEKPQSFVNVRTRDADYVHICVSKPYWSQDHKALAEKVLRVLNIAARCPESFVTKTPGVIDYVTEFLAVPDKSVQVNFYDKPKWPFAYQLNAQNLERLVLEGLDCRIAFTYDCSATNESFQESSMTIRPGYNTKSVFAVSGARFINQLVILSDNDIKLAEPLSFTVDNNAYFARYVDDNYKIACLQTRCQRGVAVNHNQMQLVCIPRDGQIYLERCRQSDIIGNEVMFQTVKDRTQTDQKMVNALYVKLHELQNQLHEQEGMFHARKKKELDQNHATLKANGYDPQFKQRFAEIRRQLDERCNEQIQQDPNCAHLKLEIEVVNARIREEEHASQVETYPLREFMDRDGNSFSGVQGLFQYLMMNEIAGQEPVSVRQLFCVRQGQIAKLSTETLKKALLEGGITQEQDKNIYLHINNNTLTASVFKNLDINHVSNILQQNLGVDQRSMHTVHLVQFQITAPPDVPDFESRLADLVQFFGVFVSHWDKKKTTAKSASTDAWQVTIRTAEAAHAFLIKYNKEFPPLNQRPIPASILPPAVATYCKAQEYVRQLLAQNGYSNITFKNGYLQSKDLASIERFINQLESGQIAMQLPWAHVEYFNVAPKEIQRILKQFKNVWNNMKRRAIVAPVEQRDRLKGMLEKLIEDSNSDVISMMMCDSCGASRDAISIIDRQVPKCLLFCPGCIASYVQNFKSNPDSFQIHDSGCLEPLGVKLIAVMRSGAEARGDMLDALRAKLEDAMQYQPDFKFCPNHRTNLAIRLPVPEQDDTLFVCSQRCCRQGWCSSCYQWHMRGEHVRVEHGVGIQRCPGCGALSEKVDGCNHVKCARCQTHWCWMCGQRFDAGVIYQHMSQAHGGHYTARPQQ